jgi:carbamoylphosphate synthase large subunit
VALNKPIIEINRASACFISGNKFEMKEFFEHAGVKTAEYSELCTDYPFQLELSYQDPDISEKAFPAIIKHIHSSKGKGIYMVKNQLELDGFCIVHEHNIEDYIIEKYYNYSKEYRLHVTKDGCFYACRKMLKSDATDRWHRHDSNSVWIMEENELFEKPTNWDDIVAECVKALNAVGLDIGACDVKVQSEKNKNRGGNPEFIVLEINSAPSFGEVTLEKYKQKLIEIINERESL